MITLFLAPALLLLALLSYSQHRAAVILLAGLLPTYLLRFSVFGLPTNFLELAILIVALSGLAQPAIRSRWRAAWQHLPLTFIILVLLFILASSLSAYISPHPYTSLGILKGWILIPILFGWLIFSVSLKIAVPAGLSPVALPGRQAGLAKEEAFGEGWENWKLKIINALLASGVAVSIIGLFQVFTLDRVKSVYDVPNSLALFLAPLLVIALWQKRWLYAAPIALALLATQSVAALIAVALTLLLGIILWTNSYQKKHSLLALTLVLILAAAYLSSTGRLNYLAHSPNSLSVRRQLWSISWELIKEHPVLGIGLGTFEPAYQQKLHERFRQFENCRARRPVPRSLGEGGSLWRRLGKLKIENCTRPLAEYVFRDPHNWILSFWLNTSLLGLLSFLGLHAFIFWRVIRRPKLPVTSYQLLAPALALLALGLFGLADTIYFKNDLAALHWALIALLIAKTPRNN